MLDKRPFPTCRLCQEVGTKTHLAEQGRLRDGSPEQLADSGGSRHGECAPERDRFSAKVFTVD